jgi:hypothetical protein
MEKQPLTTRRATPMIIGAALFLDQRGDLAKSSSAGTEEKPSDHQIGVMIALL